MDTFLTISIEWLKNDCITLYFISLGNVLKHVLMIFYILNLFVKKVNNLINNFQYDFHYYFYYMIHETP